MSAATALLASNSFRAVFLAPSAEQTKAFSSPVAACLQTWHQQVSKQQWECCGGAQHPGGRWSIGTGQEASDWALHAWFGLPMALLRASMRVRSRLCGGRAATRSDRATSARCRIARRAASTCPCCFTLCTAASCKHCIGRLHMVQSQHDQVLSLQQCRQVHQQSCAGAMASMLCLQRRPLRGDARTWCPQWQPPAAPAAA